MSVQAGETWVHADGTYPDAAVRVLAVTGATVEFTPLGGGFVYRAPIDTFVAQHRRHADDAPPPAWREAVFALDSWGPWPGWWQGFRWNGWATPVFERATALALLAEMDVAFTEDGDALVVDQEPNDPLRVEPVTITIEGVERRVYAFDGWTFHEVVA